MIPHDWRSDQVPNPEDRNLRGDVVIKLGFVYRHDYRKPDGAAADVCGDKHTALIEAELGKIHPIPILKGAGFGAGESKPVILGTAFLFQLP